MANYQTHLTGGVLIGAAAALISGGLGMVTAVEMPFVALVGTWGGLAPDLDSDNSRPVQIMFTYATIIVPCVALWRFPFLHDTLLQGAISWIIIASIVRGPICLALKRLTVHRGIFHSIPAALIFGCLGFLWSGRRVDDVPLQSAMGLSAAAGYFTHLMLDEIWAVDFEGRRLKKSFGTALSLWVPSKPVTVLAYVLLVVLGGLTSEGLGGNRPEGLWSDNLGDVPIEAVQTAWKWLLSRLETVL
ncbi:MAG: membrane-bound metal-dependent hydrolase YbcI (DUF457 family) [Myxococcota bacterium]|jgi:membrane-bound metal-dependent hydrolase YbcI (DUF457 family)